VRLAYNTNGFAGHRLADAVEILAELGYEGIGLTLDWQHLDPFAHDAEKQAERLARRLRELRLGCVVETGARFLLDPRRKHQPTLLSADPTGRAQRLEFLTRAVRLAAILEAEAVSFWSGSPDEAAADDVLRCRLEAGLAALLDAARPANMPLALEPEPGMFLDTTARVLAVVDRWADPLLGVAFDVGHPHCLGEGDVPALLRAVGRRLRAVHLDDMRIGVHDHLCFGEGELAFPPIVAALEDLHYRGLAQVELSRHAHAAVETARRAKACWDRWRAGG
jgi:sugar phosphate isomerase/epimerase